MGKKEKEMKMMGKKEREMKMMGKKEMDGIGNKGRTSPRRS